MLKIILFLLGFLFPLISYANHGEDYFDKIDIAKLQQDLQSRKISCSSVVDHYIERIKLYDLNTSEGPPYNAILRLNPNIYHYAHQIDQKITNGKKLGKLACVPVLIKDVIDDIDMPTTMGSLALVDVQPSEDAAIVKQLKSEDAIIIGKTNLDEMAMGITGYSSYLGRTGNSYNSSMSPGGSSGGSAVAASLGFALVTIGTDNSGSLRIPASFNGVYSMRPTYGLIDSSGIFPNSISDVTVGPITRNIGDLAYIYEILTHKEMLPLNQNAITGSKIGLVHYVNQQNQFQHASAEIDRLYNIFSGNLRKNGANVIESLKISDIELSRKNNMQGINERVNQYLATRGAKIKSLQEFCGSGKTILLGGGGNCQNYFTAIGKDEGEAKASLEQMFESNQQKILKFMDKNQLDYLLYPIVSKGLSSYDVVGLNTILASNSRLPAVVLLIGQDHSGMPVGMELLARPGKEKELLDMAVSVKSHIYVTPQPKLPKLDKLTQKVVNLSIEDFNSLKHKIGQITFKRYIKDKGEVSAEDFRKLVRKIVKEIK